MQYPDIGAHRCKWALQVMSGVSTNAYLSFSKIFETDYTLPIFHNLCGCLPILELRPRAPRHLIFEPPISKPLSKFTETVFLNYHKNNTYQLDLRNQVFNITDSSSDASKVHQFISKSITTIEPGLKFLSKM